MRNQYCFFSVLAMGMILIFLISGVESIGVCYGMDGNNLPSPRDAINLYKSNNIGGIRLYSPNHDVLQALRGSNIAVILDVPNSDVSSLASSASAAATWVQTNIQAFSPDVSFRYIAVGNEIIPGSRAQDVLPAMKNVQSALRAAGLQNNIKVSTSVSTDVLGVSYKPSAGAFSLEARITFSPLVKFLIDNGSPLLANVYPYVSYVGDTTDISYVGDTTDISIDYALFTSPRTVVTDGQLSYQNLFDALVDALYSALEKVGGSGVAVVVSESGWPSDGGLAATTGNAQTYVSNLINHVGRGTPKRPGSIEAYIFDMFDENEKQPQGTENHFGLFTADGNPKYSIKF